MDMLSLLTGLGIGLVVVLLVWINLNKKDEANRGQLQESALRLKMLEDQAQRAETDRVSAAAKAEQKQLEIQDLLSENAGLTSTLEFTKEQLKKSQSELNEIKNLLQAHQKEAGDLRQSLTGFQEQNRYLLEKQESLKKEFEDIRRQSQLEFQNLAQKILEEKSLKFTAANKENIDNILKPLGENLDHFRKKIEETYDKESKQRFSLEEKIKDLVELNLKLSQEANNLATALKGQSKKQGNWGEIILESILERSGLQKDREYKVQVSIQSEEGKRLQPDVMVYLPEGRTILIDSKVSLVAYDRFSSAETKELQEAALKEHVASLYKHIDDLGDKRYDRVAGSFDFTMMFVPIEPAYLVALQAEPELWAYAYAKRILLISPTNLIASLRLIADLWKREQQNKNAQEIAKYGERLYDKIVLFLESMDEVGRFLNKSQDSYLKAVGQLKDGRGSLVKQAQRLRSLGLNPQKEIPVSMLPLDDDFPEDAPEEAVSGE